MFSAMRRAWNTGASRNQSLPAERGGRLLVASTISLSHEQVLPPTEAGWRRFLALAPSADMKFTDLERVGLTWWGRRIPRNLLSSAEAEDADGEGA